MKGYKYALMFRYYRSLHGLPGGHSWWHGVKVAGNDLGVLNPRRYPDLFNIQEWGLPGHLKRWRLPGCRRSRSWAQGDSRRNFGQRWRLTNGTWCLEKDQEEMWMVTHWVCEIPLQFAKCFPTASNHHFPGTLIKSILPEKLILNTY